MSMAPQAQAAALLISPYWNVNDSTEDFDPELENLLISPYWNVNGIRRVTLSHIRRLLISPYWNVNLRRRACVSLTAAPFNLSILECKCWRMATQK